MKNAVILLIPACILFIFGCTVGVDSNSSTRLRVTNIRLAYHELYLVSDGKRLNTFRCSAGENVRLVITGLTGFESTSDRIFPGISVKVTDHLGKILVNKSDLFAEPGSNGLPADSVRNHIEIRMPLDSSFIQGCNYLCRIRIWDKAGRGELIAEHLFSLK